MKQRGTIPVVRGSKEGMRNLVTGIREEVARGHSILAFPEGTRTVDGRVGPFKPGLFRVAMEVGAPIVPVAVTGMWDVMRKGSLLIRPGRAVTVYYEQPVPTAGLTEADLPDLVQTVRQAIVRRVDDDFRAQGRL
jgi:1-acyl-sn-glycerol-3-phosphate acyltransferase